MVVSLVTVPTILAALSADTNPMVMAGFVLLMVTLGLSTIAMRRRRSSRTPDLRDYARDQAARLRQQQGVREDMEQIFVQISDLARELNAQMDTRFAKLEQGIAEADEKIATLEALLRRAAGVKGVDVLVQDDATGRVPPPAPASPAPASRKGGKKIVKPDKAVPKADGPATRSERVAGKDESSPTDPGELRYSRIYGLADQGLPTIEIARQTGQTTGEVELILNLRKSRAR